jgi:hypothetical protein
MLVEGFSRLCHVLYLNFVERLSYHKPTQIAYTAKV